MKRKLIFWIMVILMMSSIALGLGIRPAKTQAAYSKNNLDHFQFKVTNEQFNQRRMAVSIYAAGEISDLIIIPIEKVYFDGPDAVVDFYLNYSHPLTSGMHSGQIVVQQIPEDDAQQFSTQVILKHKIVLNVIKGSTFLKNPAEYVEDKLATLVDKTLKSNNPIIVIISYSVLLAISFVLSLLIYFYLLVNLIKSIYSKKKHKK